MSRVQRVDVRVLDVPQPRPISSSSATYASLGVVVVEVETADGVTGQGWSHVIGGGAESIASFVRTELAPLVTGSDPDHVRDTWQRMYVHALSRGRKGVAMYAISAVDIALWDARARSMDVPLHRLLGTAQPSVPVYGDGCWLSYSHDELVAAAQEYDARSFWGVKVKVGADLADAVERVGLVRDALGPSGRVMVDANQRYGLLEATRLAPALADLDVTWFEEPLLADAPRDYAALRSRTTVPIACGENEYSRYGFRELLELGAVDILQPDVHRVGGVTEFMRIAALAEAWNVPVAPHTSWEVHSQLLLCVVPALAVEYFDWYPEGFFDHSPAIENGRVGPSAAAGLGTHIRRETLRRYAA
ncbi:mandelate racemase/muconate lactonizing enzyme family protein [Nocardioides sp. LHG3406-4]|uniref:mandelate racemase/muconate lactonizing enzyme family protein n=1 Tax=Nocardioides sp. LHG3406-4 TaxID=2804575 RepID=UPI003CF436B6